MADGKSPTKGERQFGVAHILLIIIIIIIIVKTWTIKKSALGCYGVTVLLPYYSCFMYRIVVAAWHWQMTDEKIKKKKTRTFFFFNFRDWISISWFEARNAISNDDNVKCLGRRARARACALRCPI